MNERAIRIVHTILFVLLFIIGIVSVGVSGFLVGEYNKNGYPKIHTAAFRDRLRITLTASVWTVVWTLFLGIGFQVAGHKPLFGILTHLVPIAIAFILFIIGAGSLTGLLEKIDCGKVGDDVARCTLNKSAMGVAWAETIVLFVTLVFIIAIAFKARAWGGVHRNSLYVD
ncbi:hypothetical protein Q8F55_007681 [Vanrija albida]|uniref:MARVEL domain-containing protein n=1 Tax=Vanrija albida TaxID=181172 RepID=A0ABR3PU86_9TREE